MFLCTFCSILLFVGCVSAETSQEGTPPTSVATEEEPIVFETLETRQVSTERAALETWTIEDFEGKTVTELPMLLDYLLEPTLENAVETATQVVQGTVEKVEYTAFGGQGWTILSVSVKETLDGTVEPGRMIDVYVLGGYVPMRVVGDAKDLWAHGKGDMTEAEIDNTVWLSTWEGSNTAKVDGEYIFYVEEISESSGMPTDGYVAGMGSFGQLEVNKDGTFTGKDYSTGEAVTYTQEEIPLP